MYRDIDIEYLECYKVVHDNAADVETEEIAKTKAILLLEKMIEMVKHDV